MAYYDKVDEAIKTRDKEKIGRAIGKALQAAADDISDLVNKHEAKDVPFLVAAMLVLAPEILNKLPPNMAEAAVRMVQGSHVVTVDMDELKRQLRQRRGNVTMDELKRKFGEEREQNGK